MPRLLRLSVACAVAAGIAVTCVRSAVVAAEADTRPARAGFFWPDHPEVLRAEILIGVTDAARGRTGLDARTGEKVRLLAAMAPLAPEPFAVTGAMALRQGRYPEAERRLADARLRDPRFEAGRMLLAQTYLAEGKVVPGLKELVALSEISPQVVPVVTAALAGYSRAPGSVPKLQRALRGNPDLKDAVLAYLATDARNAQLILSLASGTPRGTALADWQRGLLSSLVNGGNAANAVALWHEFTGLGMPDVGDFSNSAIRSPFTWTFLSSAAGSATAHGRGLDVQFFGESDASLASTVLTLPPGAFSIQFRVAGSPADKGSVHLLLTCVPKSAKLLELPLSGASGGAAGTRFEVPADCPAQKLQVIGIAQVLPSEVNLSITDLQVRKLG